MTTQFCENLNLEEAYVAVESREALDDWSSNVWHYATWLFGSLPYSLEFISTRGSPNWGRFTEPPERKWASLPDTEHMVSSAPAFGLTPSEKRTLDLITDHPMIPREHLARWLGVSEGRVSQMLQGTFPSYEQLIPRESETRAVLDTKELQRAARSAEAFAKSDMGVTRLEIQPEGGRGGEKGEENEKGRVTLSARSEGDGGQPGGDGGGDQPGRRAEDSVQQPLPEGDAGRGGERKAGAGRPTRHRARGCSGRGNRRNTHT